MTTTIVLRNIWTRITSDNPDMLQRARDVASFEMQNWQIRRSKWRERLLVEGKEHSNPPLGCTCEWCRATNWDGRQFIGKNGGGGVDIPTGCVPIYLQLMKAFNEELKIVNEREVTPVLKDVDWSLKREPRPYQAEALDTLVKAGGRGIIKVPTAGGKTFIMAMAISKMKRTTLIKVPRLVLMEQIRQELLDTLNIDEGDIGMIGKGKYEPSLITIITTQSLASIKKDKKKWMELMGLHRVHGWGLLIEDEVHHAASKTSYDTSMAIDSYFRLGFSATPLMREDGENIKVIAAYGDIVYEIKSDPLIASGWLVNPMIKFIPSKHIPSSRADTWDDIYRMGIVFNQDRNRKVIDIANRMHLEGRSTLIFVDRIDHGNELMAVAATNASHDIEFVHGTEPNREDIISRFKSKELPTMISTEGIIGEGFDFRGLDALIIADGGKSVIQTLQKVGRAMRPEEGKVDCKLFDFADRGKYLTQHALTRKTTWLKNGFQLDLSDTPYLR